jgi:hypothetical protein
MKPIARPHPPERWVPRVLIVSLLACSGGERRIVDPVIGEARVTATVQADPEDASVAQQLGWTQGVPNAEITLSPIDSSAPPVSFTAGGAGVVDLGVLKEGRYVVDARRVLSSQELTTVGAAGGAVGFAGSAVIEVSPNAKSFTVTIPASRRKSLIFSEVSWRDAYDGNQPYNDGGYFELYNNSDTTVYLDGVTIGFGFIWVEEGSITCAQGAYMRNDPGGIWSIEDEMFPGKGHDYPLRPGQIVTVAQDAIDHNAIWPGMPDLTKADFEFSGPADVDNPTVPNMIDRSYESFNPHGLPLNAGSHTVFLALPVSLDTLPRVIDPAPGARRWWRFPAASILDAFSEKWVGVDVNHTPCPEMVNRAFSRGWGYFIGDDGVGSVDFKYSPARKVFSRTSDGRLILQHTRSSPDDFVKGPVTPLRLQ